MMGNTPNKPEGLSYPVAPPFLPRTYSLTRPSHGNSQEIRRILQSASIPVLWGHPKFNNLIYTCLYAHMQEREVTHLVWIT